MKTPESLMNLQHVQEREILERLHYHGVKLSQLKFLLGNDGDIMRLAEFIDQLVLASKNVNYPDRVHVWGPEHWKFYFDLEFTREQVNSSHVEFVKLNEVLKKTGPYDHRFKVAETHLVLWMPRKIHSELFSIHSWHALLAGPGLLKMEHQMPNCDRTEASASRGKLPPCWDHLASEQADFGGWHILPLDWPRKSQGFPIELNSSIEFHGKSPYEETTPLLALTRTIVSLTLGLGTEGEALVSTHESNNDYYLSHSCTDPTSRPKRKRQVCFNYLLHNRRDLGVAARNIVENQIMFRPSLELIVHN